LKEELDTVCVELTLEEAVDLVKTNYRRNECT